MSAPVRTVITVTATAQGALERYEAAERAISELRPGLWSTADEWAELDARRAALTAERNEAALLLASMVSLAMRMALDERTERAA